MISPPGTHGELLRGGLIAFVFDRIRDLPGIFDSDNNFCLRIQAAHSRDFSRELAAFKDHFFRKISYKNQLLFKKNNILKV